MSLLGVELVVFDMAGTTVDDSAAGASLVVAGFVEAFGQQGIILAPAMVNRYRGMKKNLAILEILDSVGYPPDKDRSEVADQIYNHFLAYVRDRVTRMREFPGTSEVFDFLHRLGIKVGVGTGFPDDLARMIVAHLGWQDAGVIDWAMSAEEVGAGRPDPAMLHRMMALAGVTDPRMVLKVGDTVMDVAEGRNAGVVTVGVLTGTQTREDLQAAEPDYLLESIRELPRLFEGKQ